MLRGLHWRALTAGNEGDSLQNPAEDNSVLSVSEMNE